MMTKPITAFQNPITVQGKVTAKNRRNRRSKNPKPPGESALTVIQSSAAIVIMTSAQKMARRWNMDNETGPARTAMT